MENRGYAPTDNGKFKFKRRLSEACASRGVLRKKCSGNMQQIYGITPMPKCGFKKFALKLCLAEALKILTLQLKS